MKKRELEIRLERVQRHPHPTAYLEQYTTPATIAADLLYVAHGKGDIAGRKVLDAGCGTGILGIGAALLGASEVIGIDTDQDALAVAMDNARRAGVELSLLTMDIREFPEDVDTVVQNPPFGAQRRHADAPFLETALRVGTVVYTIHNATTEPWLRTQVQALGGTVTDVLRYAFPIPHTFDFHRKDVEEIPVIALRVTRANP